MADEDNNACEWNGNKAKSCPITQPGHHSCVTSVARVQGKANYDSESIVWRMDALSTQECEGHSQLAILSMYPAIFGCATELAQEFHLSKRLLFWDDKVDRYSF